MVPLAKWISVTQDPGFWKIAPPDNHGYAEAAGLDKDESDFVSKYLSLADQLLKQDSAAPETATTAAKPILVAGEKPIAISEQKPVEKPAPPQETAA